MIGQLLVVAGARAMVANKLIIVRAHAAQQLLRFAQEFGLTPSAWTQVEVGPHWPGPADNPFAG
jgi:phage terminase small subunit